MSFLALILGGFIGSISRAFMSQLFKRSIWATLLVNILGSILLAYIFKYYLMGQVNDLLFAFLGIGFAGSFTTFSTFSVEVITYIKNKNYFKATAYTFVSILITLIAIRIIL